eukprot:tig00000852_g5053.t1
MAAFVCALPGVRVAPDCRPAVPAQLQRDFLGQRMLRRARAHGTPDRRFEFNLVASAAPEGEVKRVALIALGCPKNTVDAEVMLGDLHRKGFEITSEVDKADCVIINTCAFVEEAKNESIEAILEAAQLKQAGNVRGVVVTGCLAQRYSGELAEEIPESDAVVGFAHYADIPKTIEKILEESGIRDKSKSDFKSKSKFSGLPARQNRRVAVGSATVGFRPEHDRLRITPQHTAFLRVAEGCDHACTFCAIPGFRGKFRSKPWDAVLDEAKRLVDSGVKELNLIAEDTNQYGMDFPLSDGRRLSDLLRALNELEGLTWIRILYAYPSYFSEDLITAIAELPKVVKYLDMPLQHISDGVLKNMNRPGRSHTENLLNRLREGIPGLRIRTTFIAGFPGETDDDHRELCEFIQEFKFERAGFFAYSEEDGTPAGDGTLALPLVPQELRDARRDELVSIQQQISDSLAKQMMGQEVELMVDAVMADGSGASVAALCRSTFDAPEIDNIVEVKQLSRPDVESGDVITARIIGALDGDLFAEMK